MKPHTWTHSHTHTHLHRLMEREKSPRQHVQYIIPTRKSNDNKIAINTLSVGWHFILYRLNIRYRYVMYVILVNVRSHTQYTYTFTLDTLKRFLPFSILFLVIKAKSGREQNDLMPIPISYLLSCRVELTNIRRFSPCVCVCWRKNRGGQWIWYVFLFLCSHQIDSFHCWFKLSIEIVQKKVTKSNLSVNRKKRLQDHSIVNPMEMLYFPIDSESFTHFWLWLYFPCQSNPSTPLSLSLLFFSLSEP